MLTGCTKSTAPAAPTTQTVAGMSITVTPPSPPHTGDDTVVLTLTDAATGEPVGNANITAEADAQAPRLKGASVSGRAQGNGRYEIPVRLPVVSNYEVLVTIQRVGRPAVQFSFPLDVEQ